MRVPKIIKKTPKYWILDNCSFKKKKENIELNIGEKERRGIVKLRSDCLIAFKNKSAENKPIKIKIIPGRK